MSSVITREYHFPLYNIIIKSSIVDEEERPSDMTRKIADTYSLFESKTVKVPGDARNIE